MANRKRSTLALLFPKPPARIAFISLCAAIIQTGIVFRVQAASSSVQIPLTVERGTPLRVELVNRVPIKRAGVMVEGRLASPVYVFNRRVLPAGCELLGRVTNVESASHWKRARAIMSGNFTPLRTAQVEFDTLILKDGSRMRISTSASQGELAVIHLESGTNGKRTRNDPVSQIMGRARHQIKAEESEALAQARTPGRLHRLKNWAKAQLIAWLPYHRQAYPPGTIFTARLETPLRLGSETVDSRSLVKIGTAPPPDSIVHARLLTALDSATARRGAAVTAIITQPLFSPKHFLIIPQGSLLSGQVIDVRPARMFHRNGKLRFTFRRLAPPAAPQAQVIHASVQGLTVASASHLKLDAEGGVAPVQTKKRFVAPALSIALAAWTSTPDRDAVNGTSTAVAPGQGGGLGQVLAGGGGFGLLGSAVALASHSYVITGALGFYSAAWSVYTHLLARGEDVVFPANTPMEIRFGSHHRSVRRAKTGPGAFPHAG